MTERGPIASPRPPMSVVRPSTGLAPAKPGLSPREFLGVFRRHLLLIFLLTILGGGLGAAAWTLLRKALPSFTAQAYVEVLPPVQEDPTVISSVQVNKDIRYTTRVTIASLIREQGTLEQLLKSDKVRQTQWFTREVGGDVPTAILYLMKYFGAYAQRDGDFVAISMSCGVAKESADIVNTMADLFVKSQGNQKRTEIQDSLTQLETRRVQIQEDLDRANKSLDEVRTKWGITDVSSQKGAFLHEHPIVTRFNQLQLQENNLLQQITQMEAVIKSLQALAAGPINEQVERIIERDPIFSQLTSQIAAAEAQRSAKLTKFGEGHRLVQMSNELIQELQEKRAKRRQEIADQTRQGNLKDAQQALAATKEQLAELQRLRQEAEAKKKDFDMASIEYERIVAVRDERISVLNTIKEQIEKMRILLDDPKTPKVVVKAWALPPLEMDASRHWLVWLPLGTVLGLLLGVGLAFAMELFCDLLRTPSDVARSVDVPLLGVIPDDSEDDLPDDVDLCRVVAQAPYSILAESYRRLRTNLEQWGGRTWLITSGDAGDGATSSAVNLAIALAASGKKVLLIDGNFRHPDCQSIFPAALGGGPAKPAGLGLSHLLLGQCTVRDAIRPSGLGGLSVMDAGMLPPHPAELLAGPRMEALLKELAKAFHHVVIDSPPSLLVSDAKVLARVADATVVVFSAARTRRGAALRTLDELRAVKANVVGCVLFGVKAMKGGYYRRQYKSYRRYLKPQLAR
jgi:capsular exopolysaccharide synthesis family protein